MTDPTEDNFDLMENDNDNLTKDDGGMMTNDDENLDVFQKNQLSKLLYLQILK